MATTSTQLEFARHVYDNQQTVIRQLDVKAGVFVTLLVILVTGGIPLFKDVGSKLIWSGKGAFTSYAYLASSVFLAAFFVLTVLAVQRVIEPRGSEHQTVQTLMYAEEIKKIGHIERYHEAVSQITDDQVLSNLTRETYQLSSIVGHKLAALRLARWPTILAFLFWAANTVLAVFILSWR